MCFCLLFCHAFYHCLLLSCFFSGYSCVFSVLFYMINTQGQYFSPKVTSELECVQFFCAQLETPKGISFSQGESSASSVMAHDEVASSRLHKRSLTSENVHLLCRQERACSQNVFREKAKSVCLLWVYVILWKLIKFFTIFLHFFSGSSVNLYLPKFTLYGTYDLKDILYKMGIMDLFTDKADLSGITGQPQHRISQVSHTAFSFVGWWLQILASLSVQLFMVQNSC